MRSVPSVAVALLLLAQAPLLAEAPSMEGLEAVPETSPPLADEAPFVPAGFSVEHRTEADLDGDARPDTVLELLAAAEDEDRVRPRSLVILLRTAGGLRLAGSSPRALVGVGVGGLQGRRANDYSAVFIRPAQEGGLPVLFVDDNLGSRKVRGVTQRFSWDPGTGRIRLIGRDEVEYDVATGKESRYSHDLLTGTISMKSSGPGGRASDPTLRRVEPSFVAVEDADFFARPSYL